MEAALVPADYVRAVSAAGGAPVLVPPGASLPETLDAIDGLVFSGGSDLDPELYEAEPHPETSGVIRERDDFELELPPAFEGNAYESSVERFPSTLREAVGALEAGAVARNALGDDVVDHYLNYARTEQELFDRVVTDWERSRLYERG